MSTVIFFDGVLYADTQGTETAIEASGGYKVGDIMRKSQVQKIFKVDNGPCSKTLIMGFVGTVAGGEDFLKWTASGRSADKNYTFETVFHAFEYDGITLTKWSIKSDNWKWRKINDKWRYCKTNKFVIDNEYIYHLYNKEPDRVLYATIGSGSSYAIGHLEIDKNPVAAIRTASKCDHFTNDRIEKVDLFSDGVNVIYDENESKKQEQLELNFK